MSEKIPLTQEDLEKHLQEQISFLKVSCDSFDEGFDSEAKRLATTIRVLVHDSRTSQSLLGLLGKREINFLDSTFDLNPLGGKALHGGLVCIEMGPSESSYKAMLDDLPAEAFKWVDFNSWWNMPVLDGQKLELTREKMILTAANQDGGAHVDSKLDKQYYELARKNSLGWFYGTEDGKRQIEGADRVAIRQIAHEVIKTLVPGYTKKPKQNCSITLGGFTINSKPPNEVSLYTNRKIGRNELCPCGSGKKYKRCHGNH